MTRVGSWVAVVLIAGVCISSSCSRGPGGSGPPPNTFGVTGVTPAAGSWVASDVVPEVVFSRELEPASVSPAAVVLFDGAGGRVPGRTEVAGDVVRFRPSSDLAEDDYFLLYDLDVRALDGSALRLLAPAPVQFSVRTRGGTWAVPAVPLGAIAAGDREPVLAQDLRGGASLVWMHAGSIMAAEYDADIGWRQASVVDRLGNDMPRLLLAARGAGTLAVVTVGDDAFNRASSLVRVRVSRRVGTTGSRIWEAATVSSFDLVADPQVWVSASGRPFLLTASTQLVTTQLRVLWLDGQGGQADALSAPAAQFVVDGVYLGGGGDVAVAWTQTTGSERGSRVRVHRQAGWDAALELPLAPSQGGIGDDGNAWLLVPQEPSRALYLVQDNGRWGNARPTVPVGLEVKVSRGGDLHVLDWRSDAGGERLVALRYDRLGQLQAERVLAGPTQETLRLVAFSGDPEAELLAVWRQGQSIQHALSRRGDWTQARPWRDAYAPVPIERAVITPAATRTWLTWVQDDRLVTTHVTPLVRSPLPRANPRPSPSPTPLLDERLFGSARGALLVLWQQDGTLFGQDVRD